MTEYRYRCKEEWRWGYCNLQSHITEEKPVGGMVRISVQDCGLDPKTCKHYRKQPVPFSEELEVK